jgi:excisionase family DNA binding protein
MTDTPDDMLDVRHAAQLIGRHPETVRRWVWSGRLASRRQGNRLLVARADVEALAGHLDRRVASLAAWAERAAAARGDAGTAADLVIEDRNRRSHAGR